MSPFERNMLGVFWLALIFAVANAIYKHYKSKKPKPSDQQRK